MNFLKLTPFFIYHIVGNSMYPSLKSGQKVIGVSWFSHIKENDVVVFENHGRLLIKRIIKTKSDEVWLEGDNKKESSDSRSFGWINKSQIIAKVTRMI